MNDEQFNQIKMLLQDINNKLTEKTKDSFLLKLFDDILSGTVAGLITGIVLYFLLDK